jgi:lipopolysaccharide/colanic/teichoic acid biosynthesis glycosyltransferase
MRICIEQLQIRIQLGLHIYGSRVKFSDRTLLPFFFVFLSKHNEISGFEKVIPVSSDLNRETLIEDDPNYLAFVDKRRVFYYVFKRVIDITIAATLLVLLSPLLLLISLAIAIYSPGPIFFLQKRVGAKRVLRGKITYWKKEIFNCYKFRTMKVNADPAIHEAFVQALINNDTQKMSELQGESTEVRKLVRDPRVTRPGRLLRKLSLDELPQFWNVLRGDMSLVGPRPAIPYEVDMYKPWHKRRLEAQPGITGLQQVTARSAEDFDQQVRLDLEYIENQSIWLDFKIIIMTRVVILSTKGAE